MHKFKGFELAEGVAWVGAEGFKHIDLVDTNDPATLLMQKEEPPTEDAPRLAPGLHCAIARYTFRLDPRDCAEIGREFGVSRQYVNLLAVRLADRLGLPTERPKSHREKKRKRKQETPPNGMPGGASRSNEQESAKNTPSENIGESTKEGAE